MITLTFPQLTTGNVSQFPVRKRMLQRTIVNRLMGEQLTKMTDPEGAASSWDLEYTGLTDAEMGAFDSLFEACEGRLRAFLFLDPISNLLRWTEDLSKSVWQTSMSVTGGIEDPWGGTGACRLTNGAQATQSIIQGVETPGWFTYTFSVWVKSGSTELVQLALANSDGVVSTAQRVSSDWRCVSVSGAIEGAADEIRCSIEVPGGSAIEVFGPQLDAQRDAAGYRRNNDVSGACMARFDQDELERISFGPDNHATHIRVVAVQE